MPILYRVVVAHVGKPILYKGQTCIDPGAMPRSLIGPREASREPAELRVALTRYARRSVDVGERDIYPNFARLEE